MFAARSTVRSLVFSGALLGVVAAPLVAQEPDVVQRLRGRIEALRASEIGRAEGDRILAIHALPAFYEARGFEPVWVGPGGAARLGELAAAITAATPQGLDPADYHLDEIQALAPLIVSGSATATDSVDLELLASDAFMLLGSHLLNGRVNPETIDPEWLANRRSAVMEDVLATAVSSGRIRETLLGLAPTQVRYRRMAGAAERLRNVERGGGWPMVPAGPTLEVGSEGGRVAALRRRLQATADLDPLLPELDVDEGEAAVFDDQLAEAVRRFQMRHGLDVDGRVGAATLAAMNVSAGDRARQLEINMERWRWLPADLGGRHIEVNIAGFEATVVESGRVVRTHRAIVGREYRQTPMFSATMTYLVLSPYWHVPPNIASADKLPQIKQDAGIFAAQRFTLLDQATNLPVDPLSVDWGPMTGAELNRRYRIRQDPGPLNALGTVKFMFPNRHNVYLHDTPSRELFARTVRGFSSGCIRVENPLALAEYLLADQEGWDRARIDSVVALGVERSVTLRSPLPVHLLYWTAWADGEGAMYFRDDIYGRDRAVWNALQADPPEQ